MQKRLTEILKENIIFVAVLILAGFLRLYALHLNPPSLNWDEISHGYNAFSVLKTGKDEWGVVLPVIFRAFGDYKLPFYIYSVVLSGALFGFNEFVVRLPSALSGISIVILTYFITIELFKDKRKALVAAFLMAIEPWGMFLSRGAFEANMSLALILAGVYFFIKKGKKHLYLPLAVVFFGVSVWTYNSARVFVPLFLVFLLHIFKKEFIKMRIKSKRTVLKSAFLLILFFIPMFLQFGSDAGMARYEKVTILDEGAIEKINEKRSQSSLNPIVSRIAYNKVNTYVFSFVNNWASHYSGKFLFFEGGSNYQFNVPGHGLIYPVNSLFFIIGIFYLLLKRDKYSILILGWLYLGSVPSSLTREAPHTLRAITMLPAPMIITSVGLVSVMDWMKNKTKLFKPAAVIYILFLSLSFVGFLKIYFGSYPVNYSWSWQYGYKEAVEYVKDNYNKYDKILFTKKYGEPHIFVLFYTKWDPASYRDDKNLIRFKQTDWFWVDGFDKFYFVNDWDIKTEKGKPFILESGKEIDCMDLKCLLVTSPGNSPSDWKKIKTIPFLNGDIAFEAYEN